MPLGDLLSHEKHAHSAGPISWDLAIPLLSCSALAPCAAPFWNSWSASTTRYQPKDRSDLFVCDTRSRYQIHVADKTRPPSRMPTSSRAVAITKVRIRKVRPQRVLEGAGLCRKYAATAGHLGRSWAGAGRARRVCNVGTPRGANNKTLFCLDGKIR